MCPLWLSSLHHSRAPVDHTNVKNRLRLALRSRGHLEVLLFFLVQPSLLPSSRGFRQRMEPQVSGRAPRREPGQRRRRLGRRRQGGGQGQGGRRGHTLWLLERCPLLRLEGLHGHRGSARGRPLSSTPTPSSPASMAHSNPKPVLSSLWSHLLGL